MIWADLIIMDRQMVAALPSPERRFGIKLV